jgi:bacterial/archaeal transporter family protein
MERWVLYAIISMLFAGFTAVVAKQGLAGISAELGLTVRTIFVCIFVLIFAALSVAPAEIKSLQKDNYVWLTLSAVATAGS